MDAHSGLQPHSHDPRSSGTKTVVNITFNLNKDGLLECPLTRAKAGDGTVPLVSQEALMYEASTAGNESRKVIRGGKHVEHAEIYSHVVALEQVVTLLKGSIVAPLRREPCK